MPDGMIQKERKKRIIKQAAMKAILVIIYVSFTLSSAENRSIRKSVS